MVVKFVFGDAREWRYIVESLATLIDEANFIFTPEGLRLRALDPSRIAMVNLELPSIAFEEYSCDQETKAGISFEDLTKVLKRGRADEKVEFSVEGGRLRVKIIGKASRTFSLPLIDVAGEELPLPKISFTVTAKLLSDTLKDAIGDVELVSDSVRMEAVEECLKVKASSDKGEVEVSFDKESGALIEYDVAEPSSASYSVSYLSDMIKKAKALADIATLQFSTNKPLSLTFELTGGGKLSYFLAPRIEA